MQYNRLLLALPIVAIIVASGCTTTTTGIGNGVTIMEFSPDFPSVQSGDPVQLQVRFQNQGEVKAYNVVAEITGIDTQQWGGTFGSSFTNAEFGELVPFDKETNTPGSIRTKIWQLTAPDQPKGINTPFTPIVKISYDYKTSAQKLIWIVDADELRRITQSGSTLPTETQTFSSGPLSVVITTGNYEKTTADRFNRDNLFPVQITITNTGGGYVVPAGTGSSFYGGAFSSSYFGDVFNYPVGIKVTPPQGTSFVSTGGFGGSDDCSTGVVTRELFKDQSVVITCELSVDSPPTYRESRPLQVDAFYRYQTEKTTSLQVFGTNSNSGGIGGYGY